MKRILWVSAGAFLASLVSGPLAAQVQLSGSSTSFPGATCSSGMPRTRRTGCASAV